MSLLLLACSARLKRSYTIVDYYCWLIWCEKKYYSDSKFTIVYDQTNRPIIGHVQYVQ